MNEEVNKVQFLDFLEANTLAVLSTVDTTHKPHAAPIYYIVEDNFTILFATPEKSQKVSNITHGSEVVLTIVDEAKKTTMQIRGTAQPVDSLTKVLDKLAAKLNTKGEVATVLPLLKHKNQTKTAVRVMPSEIIMRTYSDLGLEEKRIQLKN